MCRFRGDGTEWVTISRARAVHLLPAGPLQLGHQPAVSRRLFGCFGQTSHSKPFNCPGALELLPLTFKAEFLRCPTKLTFPCWVHT